MPGAPATAIGLAITHLNLHSTESVKIALAVLDAGADPNDGGGRQLSPVASLVNHPTVLATDAVGLIDSLANAVCDLKRLSNMPWETVKKTPLDIAVSRNRIDFVLCLLSHDAGDRDAGISADKVPGLVEKSLQRMRDCGDIQPPRGLRAASGFQDAAKIDKALQESGAFYPLRNDASVTAVLQEIRTN